MTKQTIAQKILIASIGDFNRDHPERQLGELYIGNATRSDFYNHIGWKTKRLGFQAYTKDGELINDLFPVFIQAEEAEIPNIDLSKAVYPKEGNYIMTIYCIYYDGGCDSSETQPYDSKSYFLTLESAQKRLRKIVEKELTYLIIIDDNRAERHRQALFIEEIVVNP